MIAVIIVMMMMIVLMISVIISPLGIFGNPWNTFFKCVIASPFVTFIRYHLPCFASGAKDVVSGMDPLLQTIYCSYSYYLLHLAPEAKLGAIQIFFRVRHASLNRFSYFRMQNLLFNVVSDSSCNS